MEEKQLASLFMRFPYLEANEWDALLKSMRPKSSQCPPRVRNELVRLAFRTRPPFNSNIDIYPYGHWIVFVLKAIWPLSAGLQKEPSAKEVSYLLNHTTAIGLLLYGSEDDYNRILKQPDLSPENTHRNWSQAQKSILDSLAHYDEGSTDFHRSFIYDWRDEGQARFIDQVIKLYQKSHEPYPPEDLERGERHLTRHHTLWALLYVASVILGIILIQPYFQEGAWLLFAFSIFPVVIFVLCVFIWGFPALLPHLMDFIHSRK